MSEAEDTPRIDLSEGDQRFWLGIKRGKVILVLRGEEYTVSVPGTDRYLITVDSSSSHPLTISS